MSDPGHPPSAAAGRRVAVVIPCFEEEGAIAGVVEGVRGQGIDEVIVVDGGSRDRTAELARSAGARVIVEPRRGYGRALLTGIAALGPDIDAVVFLDGDGSDRPEMIPAVLDPLRAGRADFVLGSRLRGEREPGSLALPQIVAGHVAGVLIRLAYGVRFTDMSPFRAIRREALDRLGMADESYGWNLEMQMRAAAAGLRIAEVAVGQRRRRAGVSKVSGNVAASVRAAWVIAATFVRLAWGLGRGRHESRR